MLQTMGDLTRRRTTLGINRSAALPLLWEACAAKGWSDARLAREMGEETSIVARLIYGDRRATLKQGAKLLELLGIPLSAWEEPTRATRRKHIAPPLGPEVSSAARAS